MGWGYHSVLVAGVGSTKKGGGGKLVISKFEWWTKQIILSFGLLVSNEFWVMDNEFEFWVLSDRCWVMSDTQTKQALTLWGRNKLFFYIKLYRTLGVHLMHYISISLFHINIEHHIYGVHPWWEKCMIHKILLLWLLSMLTKNDIISGKEFPFIMSRIIFITIK